MQARTGSYNEENRTDLLANVFSGIVNMGCDVSRNGEPRTQSVPQSPNNRDRLFKSSWRQFGLLSCLDDETMQECISCMKVCYFDCVEAYCIFTFAIILTLDDLHRCKRFRKVKPSSNKDLLAQHCISWTWALRASQLSTMTFKSA
jgi:hypothetical protein